ncbi:MAG TPA: 3'-5' exonuclease [Pyrinomonadaceae bacterium]|nr:3'-5' exonuclease [Pyrinomonadaceae bacterium]
MLFNSKLLYTPALEPYELNERALLVDTETVGAGPSVEIIEIALGDISGRIVFDSLVRPVFNSLPQPSRHQRFSDADFPAALGWADIWPRLSELINGKLLVAYNAAFDRRALAATCSRYRLSSGERGWRCAMQLVKQKCGAKKSLTLEDACALYGVEGGCHRAARDVEATARLLKAMLG